MKKKILLIICIFVAMAGVIIFLILLNKKNIGRAPGLVNYDKVASEHAKASKERCNNIVDVGERQDCQNNGYDVWLNSIRDKAYEGQNEKFCEIIPIINDRDICYIELVRVSSLDQLCAKVIDRALIIDCDNFVISKSNNFSACNAIVDESEKDYCYERVIMNSAKEGQKVCLSVSKADQNKCWEVFYTREALTKVDYDICNKIPSPDGRKSCLKRMPEDFDGDKLSDYSEISIHRTDPRNRDSDGDGYNDGEEVKSGHDPLKQ